MNRDPEAYPSPEGSYKVRDAYSIKDQLKALGGRYNASDQTWIVFGDPDTLSSLRELRVGIRVYGLRDAFCHETATRGYFLEADIARGYTTRNFCGNCDSQYRDPVDVVEIRR